MIEIIVKIIFLQVLLAINFPIISIFQYFNH